MVCSKQANWLANIIASIDEPYYGADSDERKIFYYSTMYNTASNAEEQANNYKSMRNTATARAAMSYYYMGDYESALPLLLNALDLIEIDDTENWELCADAINDIVSK